MDLDFNVMDYAPGNESSRMDRNEERDPMEPGKYVMEIVESSDEISAAGNRYAKLKLSVVDGPHKGTWVWDNLNLYHPTESVRDMARKILWDITKALGMVKTPEDTSDLHYKPMLVALDVEPERPKENGSGESWPPKNVVKKYLSLSGDDKERSAARGLANEAQSKEKTKIELDKIDSNLRGPSMVGGHTESEPVQDDIPF